MELLVKNILKDENVLCSLSFDGTLPLVLNFNTTNDSSSVVHYELITDHDSFSEIEIYKDTGLIKRITLVNCNELDVEKVESLEILDAIKEQGLLIIDVDLFAGDDYFDRFKREKGFKVQMDRNNSVLICFKDIPVKKYVQVNDNCYFGLSQNNELLSFLALNLTEEEIKLFNQSI